MWFSRLDILSSCLPPFPLPWCSAAPSTPPTPHSSPGTQSPLSWGWPCPSYVSTGLCVSIRRLRWQHPVCLLCRDVLILVGVIGVSYIILCVAPPTVVQRSVYSIQILLAVWVIPYQFSKGSHMTSLELDETWCVSSPSVNMIAAGV